MKSYILLFILILFQVSASAQQTILQDYLAVKDALVASKSDLAIQGAQKLTKSIQSLDAASLPPGEKKLFNQQKPTLVKLTEAIASENDIEKQRGKFAELSVILWPIVKDSSTIDQPLFYDYCPMKKMYWISAEEAIKNPYYGSRMLTCGSISEKSNQ
jgi:hypothetical protein